jgi:hypothetical protein
LAQLYAEKVLQIFLGFLVAWVTASPSLNCLTRKAQSISKRIFLKKFSRARRERRPWRVFSLRHVLAKLIEIMAIMAKASTGSAD